MKITTTNSGLLFLALLFSAYDGGSDPSDIPERFREFADAIERERVALGAPGLAVAVIERGEVTFARGFGKKDSSKPDPVLPTTLFRIGSCTNANAAHLQSSMLVALQTIIELPPPSPMPDVAPKPERYPLYAGVYNDAFGVGVVNIAAQDGKLTFAIPSFDADGTPYMPELEPLGLDNFIITAGGEQRPLTFIADETGTYKYIRSRPYVATRREP